MSRPCTICAHERRDAIDLALVSGTSLTGVAAGYGLSYHALLRHKTAHLPAALARAREAREAIRSSRLIRQLRSLQARTLSALRRAERGGDYRAVLAGIREARATCELLARLAAPGESAPSPSLVTSAEWIAVRGALLRALEPHPDARRAVADALADFNQPVDGPAELAAEAGSEHPLPQE